MVALDAHECYRSKSKGRTAFAAQHSTVQYGSLQSVAYTRRKKCVCATHWMQAKVNHSNSSIQIKCNRAVKPENITQKCKCAERVIAALSFSRSHSQVCRAFPYNGLFMRILDSNGWFAR